LVRRARLTHDDVAGFDEGLPQRDHREVERADPPRACGDETKARTTFSTVSWHVVSSRVTDVPQALATAVSLRAEFCVLDQKKRNRRKRNHFLKKESALAGSERYSSEGCLCS
jgi:hypothetical protein